MLAFEVFRALVIAVLMGAAIAVWWALARDAPIELGALLWTIGLGVGIIVVSIVIGRNLRDRWRDWQSWNL